MHALAYRAVLSGILGLSLIASACGSSGGGSPSGSAGNKGTVTVAGFNFSESSILVSIYGGALKGDGYTVNYKLNLGNREVVEPALEKGDIDLYPGYAATELEFLNKGAGQATGDSKATTNKLNELLKPKSLIALDPSSAADTNAFAMTKEGAAKFGNPTKLSDLAKYDGKLTLGGPAECPKRPFCQPGLEKTYGFKFKAFKALDFDGPLLKAALTKGDVDLGEIGTTDATVLDKGFVVLQDDKKLQAADNVVPVGRTKVLDSGTTKLLNQVSAKLTTEDIAAMNKKADVDKADPDQVAKDWLKSHGFKPR